jgi:Flp pilus assembly protein TadD
VALHSTGATEEAIASLETALAAHPDDRDILQALASFHAERGDAEESRNYAKRLQGLSE